ncbi:MAG: Beta-galactosidase C-terminal domain [Treponema sp.]|nr:Beta-galactosidase C-terminal domain [Treponema sp.]
MDAPLPEGVTAQVRANGNTDFVFVMNFSSQEKTVDAGADGKKTLAPFDVWIIERRGE